MRIVVLADAVQKENLLATLAPGTTIIWVDNEQQFLEHTAADVFIDLEFMNQQNRINLLKKLLPKPVVINSVINTIAKIGSPFIRINGWNTFLASPLVEAFCNEADPRQKVEEAFSVFGKRMEWLADDPGFVTPRVVSMIVNEAFTALGEGVSTKEEINTAMKLGTAYPYGPFEWAEKIGVQNIVTLLNELSKTQTRYKPSELLVQETAKAI